MKLFNSLFAQRHTGVALCDCTEQVTYPQVISRITTLACALRNVAGGSPFRVLCCEKACVEVCIALLAIIESGGMVLMYQPQAGSISDVAEQYEVDLIMTNKLPDGADRRYCYAATLLAAAADFQLERSYTLDLSDVCIGFFTSGTSSKPKCVLLTQENLACNVVSGCDALSYAPDDVHLLLLPLFHAFGFTCSLLAVMYSGGCLCIGGGPANLLKDLSLYRPSFLQVVPMIAKALLKIADLQPVSIKKILCGGAQTPVELIEAFRKIGIGLYSCYGLTEASPCVACNDLSVGKEHTSGRLLSCNEISFRDNEILLRGSNIMYGYYGMPPIEGWYATGDCGYLDADGYLCVTGRKDRMIKTPEGEKIHPELIESALTSQFGADECCVCLQSDRVIAIVYCKTLEFPRAAALAWLPSHLPAGYHLDDIVLQNDPFPKTMLSKVIRK